MKKIFGLIMTVTLVYLPVVQGAEFSDKEKAVIYTNAVKVLENYQTVINQMGVFVVNDIEKAKSSSEGFLELFVNRQVLLFNDLDPSHKLSEFYEAETYASNVILWYPDGLSITLDLANARVSNIMDHGESVYSLDIMVKKTMNGNYLNQTMNKNTEELTFRIAFGVESKSPGSFRIVGIRNAASNVVVDYSKALQEVNSEDFNAEDMSKIESEVKGRLRDYANFLSLLGDPQETNDDKEFYKTSFNGLFPNTDIRVYNDIAPNPQTKLITVTEYLTAYMADYPNGIRNLSVTADSAKIGNVMKNEDGSYYTYANAMKFFSGSYQGKEIFRENFPLIFKVSFNAAGKTFTDFKFNSVDIASQNFYNAADGAATDQKPELVIQPVTRKGLGLMFTGSFGQTNINSEDINSTASARTPYTWDVTALYGISAGVSATYNFTDNIAVRGGLEFNTFSTGYKLITSLQNTELSQDVNGDYFYKIVDADLDSIVKMNFLTLPVMASFTSGKPGKLGFYAEAGMKFSIPVTTTYNVKGNYETKGYYPDGDITMTAPEIGWFYKRDNFNESGDVKLRGINMAVYGSAGVNIPIGYYSNINIGPEILIGLTDVMRHVNNYRDIFDNPYEHKPTKIKSFGLRVSFAYKL
ncbi:MAG TPA: outer membrane beta-barrel protein [Bacteroidales bacterium]|nr:outer membrane beta-barrel protein [Bacteroidales bacterium]